MVTGGGRISDRATKKLVCEGHAFFPEAKAQCKSRTARDCLSVHLSWPYHLQRHHRPVPSGRAVGGNHALEFERSLLCEIHLHVRRNNPHCHKSLLLLSHLQPKVHCALPGQVARRVTASYFRDCRSFVSHDARRSTEPDSDHQWGEWGGENRVDKVSPSPPDEPVSKDGRDAKSGADYTRNRTSA